MKFPKEIYQVTIDNYNYLFSDIGVCLDFIQQKLDEGWEDIKFLDRELNKAKTINDIIDYSELVEEY